MKKTTILSFLLFSTVILLSFCVNINTTKAIEVGPKITFTFDVSGKELYDITAPVLAKYKFPGVMFAEVELINSGEDWAMDWGMVRDLRDSYGWEIGSHTITHPYLSSVSDAQLTNELLGSREAFAAEGVTVKAFATPYGDYNDLVLTEIAKYYESHRAAWGGPNQWPDIFNDYELVSMEAANTIPPATIKGWVDDAITNNQWLIILMHGVVTGMPGEYEYNLDDFKEIVDYVASRPIEVVTMSSGLEFSQEPNLISNFTFSNLDTYNWAKNWTRTNTAYVNVDTSGHGNVYGSGNAIRIDAGASQYELRSEIINIDPAQEYLLKMYQNAQNLTKGGWAVWINEFNDNEEWLGGQWLGGNYSNFIGDRYYEYKPSSLNVKKIMIHIFTEENSQLTLYVDSIFLNSLESSTLDTTPPVITLLGNSTVNLSLGDTYTEPGATALDNVDGDISASIIIGGDTVDTSTAGIYTIAYNVSDTAGNLANEVIRTVNVKEPTVVDTTPPVITLLGSAIIDLTVGDTYTELGATALDNVDGDISASIVIGGDTVDTSIAGIYTITYNVSDTAGNLANEVVRTVNVKEPTVVDTTPPVITLLGSAIIDLTVGDTYTELGATALDNVDGDITASIVIGGDTVDTSTAGIYTIAYNVSDTAGNLANEVIRTVNVKEPTVVDTTPPVITLLGSAIIDLTVGDTYTELGATALDNVDGDISASIVIGGDTVDTSIAGIYTITYNVSDTAGNLANEVVRTVNVKEPTVVDTTPPVITLLGSAIIDLTVGDTYTELGATALDNVDGNITASIVIGGDTVDTSTADTYTVTYNVSDAALNPATEVVRTVNVTEVVFNSNVNLSDIKIDGVIIPGFFPTETYYYVYLPAETVVVPTITASLEDPAASLIITPATTLPGTTTIEVTAEDTTTKKSYHILFRLGEPVVSLVPNFSFEDLTNGWANYWTRLDSNIVIDVAGHGYDPYPINSLKIIAGVNQRVAISSIINIDSTKDYELSFYQNIANFVKGGAAVWVDEFDSTDRWVSGSWLGGNYSAYNGLKTLNYTPTSNQVAKITVHMFTEVNSQLTLYIDSVVLQAQ